ncbi:hypothetical protein HY416_00405 [Candidatus Kaiserbacteria bacterium]|nr:hypothetical protein [Candidatus Kaiserbacteria bacterium]
MTFISGIRWIVAMPFLIAAFLAGVVVLVFFPVVSTVRDRDTVKDVLKDARIYEYGPDLALTLYFEELKKSANDVGRHLTTEEILGNRVAEEDLRKGLKEIVPPDWIEEQAERLIDAFYDFLEGKRETLSYSLSLDSRMEQAGDVFTAYLKSKVERLPVCGTAAEYDFDAFTATCRPQIINIAEANRAIDMLGERIKSVRFEETTISPEATVHVRPFQRAYRAAPNALLVLAGITLLFLSVGIMLIPADTARLFVYAVYAGILGLGTGALAVAIAGPLPEETVNIMIETYAHNAALSAATPVISAAVGILTNRVAFSMGILALAACATAGLALVARASAYRIHAKKVFGAMAIVAVICIGLGTANVYALDIFGETELPEQLP